jgi:hypothetical protein
MKDMKKSRFTDEQIIGFFKQAEAGMPVTGADSQSTRPLFFGSFLTTLTEQ